MDGVVKKQERTKRSRQLRILSNKLQRAFYEKYLNTEHTALFEQKEKKKHLLGFTNNYIKVKIPFNAKICKTKQQVKLLEIDVDGVMKAKIL